MPSLSRAVVSAMALSSPTADDLQQAYQAALRILYRLLFVAYAEDRDLLPMHTSRSYREHSLKRMAQRLGQGPAERRRVRRPGLLLVRGSADMEGGEPGQRGVGGPGVQRHTVRFEEVAVSKLGAMIAVCHSPTESSACHWRRYCSTGRLREPKGPVDFRSLGIREFGTIYEGLLESELSLAETDLTVHRQDRGLSARPATATPSKYVRERSISTTGRAPASRAGRTTLRTSRWNTSSTGRWNRRSQSISSGSTECRTGRRAVRFFEFRVADIAMGSGHFLVGAVDRIERRLANYLAGPSPCPTFGRSSRGSAGQRPNNLGEEWSGDAIEDTQLLRRQVARRCIFGVDMNPMAVELARLSLWIHTFVPGLPLSLLDHNLVQGNSLVGIASFEEASELFQAESGNLFAFVASERLGAVREPLREAGPAHRCERCRDPGGTGALGADAAHDASREELFTLLAASRTNSGIRQGSDRSGTGGH